MNNKCGKNTAASVRDRLLALARERGEDFQLLLTRYGLERLLYRLSQSSYRDRFILKGAMLFLLWGDQPYRPTRDVDFLGFGASSEAGLQAMLVTSPPSLTESCLFLEKFLVPPTQALTQDRDFRAKWKPGGPWH